MSYKDNFTRPGYKAQDPTKIRDLDNNKPIETIYALLSMDSDGNEGIVSLEMENSHFPMVFGDEDKIKIMRFVAEELKDKTEKRLRIVKFSNKEIIEDLTPVQKLDTKE